MTDVPKEGENSESPPLALWGQYIVRADEDVLAFAVLFEARLLNHAFYFAGQAIEKYLKALALSILERSGVDASYKRNEFWVKKHELVTLANRCETAGNFYAALATRKVLSRFSGFDLTARYPSKKWRFSTEDRPLVETLVRQIRRDLPIERDFYPLSYFSRVREVSRARGGSMI